MIIPELDADVFDPQRWGLPLEAVTTLAEQLWQVWTRYRACFTTKTRDPSAYAWVYLRGLLTMDTDRTYANIARRVLDPHNDGQNLQQFMSDSPWDAQAVLQQVQRELAATPALESGGVLILDESADEKAGLKSAGAARQHNGRLGKVEISQVGTFLAFAKGSIWTWVDGELFVPEHWFTPEMAHQRQRVGIPAERQFATKIELGWRMIERVRATGVPFEVVLCDALYGRSGWLRRQMDTAGLIYVADVPADTRVYLSEPTLGVPAVPRGRRGRRPTRQQVLNAVTPVEVRQVVQQTETTFVSVPVRQTERGVLDDPFAVRRVWTIRDGAVAQEWLIIRHEERTRYSYALSNAPPHTPRERLLGWKCLRYGIECANQEAKSDIGWDDLQAQKYRGWEHHLALTVLATWFIAQTRVRWAERYARDPGLSEELEVASLPCVSVANVRELLQAVMPVQQLTPEQALEVVVQHLVNRSRSTASRLRTQRRDRGPP
jgi:SRSO17 transposase